MLKKVPLPKNVFVQDGRLYFNKQFKGVRYTGAFELVDSNANRKTAKYIADQINGAMHTGTFDPSDYPVLKNHHGRKVKTKHPTFNEYSDIWLDKKKVLANATQRTYAALIKKHLIPYFGDMPVNEITKPVVEKWLSQLITHMTRTYANECLRRLKSIIYDAEADYDFNARLGRVKALRSYEVEGKDSNQIFTLEEASKLYYVMGTRLRTMMLCSLFAGLRTGEVIALTREDVDFQQNKLHVRASMSDGVRKSPKTRSGIRAIDMHPVLARHLAEMLASHEHDYVFVSQRGKPFNQRQNFDREYCRAKDAANVRPLRWYAFRKLFASMRYACTDAVPAQIAADMGHTDIALGLNTYSEAMPHLGCLFMDIEFPLLPAAYQQTKLSA
jgi:integrase